MQPHVWNSFDSGMWPDGSLEAARQELILAALVSEVRTYVSARADLTPSEVCNFGNLSPWHVMPGTKPRKLLTLAQTQARPGLLRSRLVFLFVLLFLFLFLEAHVTGI